LTKLIIRQIGICVILETCVMV